MKPQSLALVYPLGSHLCREPMPPMSELKRDMENLFALPQDLDWRYFMDNVQVAHVLRARAEESSRPLWASCLGYAIAA